MFFTRFKQFITSRTASLAGTYLTIIMVMSLGFSFVFFHVSTEQLSRQIPPNALFNNMQNAEQPQGSDSGSAQAQNDDGPPPQIDKFFQERIDEGRSALLTRLLFLNIGTLLVGSVVSYMLSRSSLRPIEQAMEAQAQFVSDASHELRTPLTAIQTSNEVFLRRPKATIADARKLIEQNSEDVARLKQLSDGLLNLANSKQHDAPLGPVNIQTAVSEALGMIVGIAQAKEIRVHDETSELTVMSNNALLVQILVILLDNGVKYSKKGGEITIKSKKNGKFCTIDVIDIGIGISSEDIEHIFSRFYRSDSARTSGPSTGYGLGLAIAKQIAEKTHATLSVRSDMGKGSTFSIRMTTA